MRSHPPLPEVARLHARHVNPAFVRLLGVLGYGRIFVRAGGTRIWDEQGREYLDLLAGFGAVPLGHNPPALVARLSAFLAEGAPQLVHVGPARHETELAARLASLTGGRLSMALFATSGAEAVEAAIKTARAATGRAGIVCAEGAYHGLTLGALSVGGVARMRKPFEPLLPGVVRVPFGDVSALARALAERSAAALILEPVQGEAGVVIPPPGYLARARELCDRAGTLLVLDEVQTGLGRTGPMLAGEADGVKADLVVLAKALGGSMAPVACVLATRDAHSRAYGSQDRFDLHGSTFAGHAFGCAAALATLDAMETEGTVAAAAARGAELLELLRARLAGHPLVREVRGRGLMVGVELGPTEQGVLNRLAPALVELISRNAFGQWVALCLLERGILCQPASQRWNVLKLTPPLTITAEEVQRAVDEIGAVLDEYRSLPGVLLDVSERMMRQLLNGGAFG